LRPRWMSWLTDMHRHTPRAGSGEHLRRVYAHRLPEATAASQARSIERSVSDGRVRWVRHRELLALAKQGELENGAEELKWLGMWQRSGDEQGRAVQRGFGFSGALADSFTHYRPDNFLTEKGGVARWTIGASNKMALSGSVC
jgi:hypothetical protein